MQIKGSGNIFRTPCICAVWQNFEEPNENKFMYLLLYNKKASTKHTAMRDNSACSPSYVTGPMWGNEGKSVTEILPHLKITWRITHPGWVTPQDVT